MVLRDVMTHAVEVEKETRKVSGPPGASRGGRIAALVVGVPALAFCVYSLVARPEFIWGPNPEAVAPARKDANLRFTMFLLAQRIRSYRQTNRVLPSSLAAVGENPPGITYSVLSDTVFELSASADGKAVVFRSDEPAARFLGDAPKLLQGRDK